MVLEKTLFVFHSTLLDGMVPYYAHRTTKLMCQLCDTIYQKKKIVTDRMEIISSPQVMALSFRDHPEINGINMQFTLGFRILASLP
jgi:hypothetical protein